MMCSAGCPRHRSADCPACISEAGRAPATDAHRCTRPWPLSLQGYCSTDGLHCGASVCVSGPCRKATAPKPKGGKAAKPAAKPAQPASSNPFAAVRSGDAPKPAAKPADARRAPPPKKKQPAGPKKPAAKPANSPAAKPAPAPPVKRAPQPAAATTAQPVFPAELGDATTQYSWLWGRDGELWRPGGRLPDYSHAGYMAAQRPIPSFPAGFNVRDFGAKGDGVAGARAFAGGAQCRRSRGRGRALAGAAGYLTERACVQRW